MGDTKLPVLIVEVEGFPAGLNNPVPPALVFVVVAAVLGNRPIDFEEVYDGCPVLFPMKLGVFVGVDGAKILEDPAF